MQVVPGDDKSTSYLRMDEYHHRLELRRSSRLPRAWRFSGVEARARV